MEEQEVQVIESEQNDEKRRKKRLILLLILLLLFLSGCIGFLVWKFTGDSNISGSELAKRLAAEGTDTIEITGDIYVTKPLIVNGDKILTGSGRILVKSDLGGDWNEAENNTTGWGKGCSAVKTEDTSGMSVLLTIKGGATLTMKDSVEADAVKKTNGVLVEKDGSFFLTEKAVVSNGRYVNLMVAQGAMAEIVGGELENGLAFGVINDGKLTVTGGTLFGNSTGALVYTTGQTTQSGGTISSSRNHNVYVAAGTFAMTGGLNDKAAKDGILVADGAEAKVTGGTISNCNHGLCNSGSLYAGKVTLNECGIMNYTTGAMELSGTMVDTAAVYCLANSGGKVTATDFIAKGCDTCAVYNFSGDMVLTNLTVSGSRDGNVSNAGGTLTINGGLLNKCKDKSMSVGGGKAVVTDVTIAGTTGEKYGVYVYGGELYMQDCDIKDVSSTAVKLDAGAYAELKNVAMKDIAQNGIQTDGGRIVATEISMENIGSHGLYNNKGNIVVDGATIDAVAKNMLQNKEGSTSLSGIKADNIGNHGAYIARGTVTVADSTLKNMASNGFYIIDDKNELILKKVAIEGAGKQGINNSSKVTATEVIITGAGNNGIYNKAPGSVTASNLTVASVAEHGISNKSNMKLTDVKISDTGADKNGIQNNGIMTVENVTIKSSKNHGIYNTGTMTGKNVQVNGTSHNGFYNDKGTAYITGFTVKNPEEHGISNTGTMTATRVELDGSGKGMNCIQNTGTMTVSGVTALNSKNHGIYNSGDFTATGTVAVAEAAQNGISNYGGTMRLEVVNVSGVSGYGVNNTGTLEGAVFTITSAAANGIQNSGELKITGSADIIGAGKHGIYNGKTLIVKNVTVTNAGDLLLNNSGELKAEGLTLTGTASKAIYNTGHAKLYTVQVDGSQATHDYLIDNNGGILDLNDTTVLNAASTSLWNRGNAATNVTNVILDYAENYGIFVEKGSRLSGDGLVVNHVSPTASGAEGIAIKNQGKLTMLDHVTLGDYNEAVTGASGSLAGTASKDAEEITIPKTALQIDNGSYSGYDLAIHGVGENAVYNKGIMYVKNLDVARANNGLVCRYDGWATLTGSSRIIEMKANPIRTFGKDDGDSYENGVTLYAGANLMIDGAGGHGINNKGSFLAAADSQLTVKNISGNNINAINNNGAKAKMSLGDVIIDGVHVYVTMYNATTLNTNSGNGIMNTGTLVADGVIDIRNIYTTTANGKTDNTVGSGIVVKNGGTITGKGSVTITGSEAADSTSSENSIFNGILLDKTVMSLEGDITVSYVKNQGIYAANGGAKLGAGNVTVKNVGGNGIWIRSATDSMTATGTIKVTGPKAGRGINNVGTITAANIQVSDVLGNYYGIENSGIMNITGSYLKVDNVVGTASGIRNNGGTISAPGANIFVSNINTAGTSGTGILMEKNSTLRAAEIWIDTVTNQGIQLNHANTLEVDQLVILNSTKQNGLRIYNNSNDISTYPSITIRNMVADSCKGYAITAAKPITDANLHITTLWYRNCGNAVHGNVKSGIREVKEGLPDFMTLTTQSEPGAETFTEKAE